METRALGVPQGPGSLLALPAPGSVLTPLTSQLQALSLCPLGKAPHRFSLAQRGDVAQLGTARTVVTISAAAASAAGKRGHQPITTKGPVAVGHGEV